VALAVIPARVKLVAGLLYENEGLLVDAEKALTGAYGPVDLRSATFPFAHSDYYRDMGAGLKRTFISFRDLIERDRIAEIKLFTNELETMLSGPGRRDVNIDPGYLTQSNLFLASCKDYYHRAYLTRGVYLENEYRYTEGEFAFWEWTYPDYRTQQAVEFFTGVRRAYRGQLSGLKAAGPSHIDHDR
jgi:hypothetical protein